MKCTIRFLGDPVGYTFHAHHEQHGCGPWGWIPANVGDSTKAVRINTDQAYLIEHEPDEYDKAPLVATACSSPSA